MSNEFEEGIYQIEGKLDALIHHDSDKRDAQAARSNTAGAACKASHSEH